MVLLWLTILSSDESEVCPKLCYWGAYRADQSQTSTLQNHIVVEDELDNKFILDSISIPRYDSIFWKVAWNAAETIRSIHEY
jgi:hypothetical protein